MCELACGRIEVPLEIGIGLAQCYIVVKGGLGSILIIKVLTSQHCRKLQSPDHCFFVSFFVTSTCATVEVIENSARWSGITQTAFVPSSDAKPEFFEGRN